MPRYLIKSYRGAEPYAFISYAHKDAELVFAEMSRLDDAGFRLYYDEGIHPGQSWQEELAQAIEGCSIFVIFLTNKAIASRNCMREINFALDRECEILAVHLDDLVLPPGLQLALGDRQAIVKSNHHQAEYETLLFAALGRFLDQLVDTASPSVPPKKITQPGMSWIWPSVLGAALLLVFGAGLVWRNWSEYRNDQFVRYAAFKDAIKTDDAMSAYLVGRDLDLDVLDASDFNELWQKVTRPTNLQIDTPGAEVWFRPYLHPDTPWIALGSTPFAEPMDLPRGVIALRVEKPEFVTGHYVVHVSGPIATPADSTGWDPDLIGIALQPAGVLAHDMVGVPATDMPVWVGGWTRDVGGDNRHAIPAFAVGKYEVSNAEYQAFVDAGAYSEPGYWEGLVFEVEDEAIPFDQAQGLLVDQTGVAGPASWSLGHYPEGQGEYPLTGISWYEAVAYSRFRGLTLPTVHHWARYTLGPWEGYAHLGPAISSQSNYERDGVRPISSDRGLGPWGTNDTGGNVREWVWNRGRGKHLAMGGSWSEYPTDIANVTVVDGFSRNEFKTQSKHMGSDLPKLLNENRIEIYFGSIYSLNNCFCWSFPLFKAFCV